MFAFRTRGISTIHILPCVCTTQYIIHLFPSEWGFGGVAALYWAQVRAGLAE